MPGGQAKEITGRLDALDDNSVRDLLSDITNKFKIAENIQDFETAYLKHRYAVATLDKPTFVATNLRRFLAKGTLEAVSPRLIALQEWLQYAWVDDIELALKDGLPRKTIVFTSWKGDRKTGEATGLKIKLLSAFNYALKVVKEKKERIGRNGVLSELIKYETLAKN